MCRENESHIQTVVTLKGRLGVIALVILVVYGLNTSTGVVTSKSNLQTVIPDRWRGRVFTLLDMTWAAMWFLSLGLGGLLADRIGISAVYVMGGSLLALAGLLGLVLPGRSR